MSIDAIEKAAEAYKPIRDQWEAGEIDDYAVFEDARLRYRHAFEDPATVLELVRLARIGECCQYVHGENAGMFLYRGECGHIWRKDEFEDCPLCFIRDLYKEGTRHDTTPTMGGTQSEREEGYTRYIMSMDRDVRERAARVLKEPA